MLLKKYITGIEAVLHKLIQNFWQTPRESFLLKFISYYSQIKFKIEVYFHLSH